MCVFVRIIIYICICLYMYIYIYTHTFLYVYIYTCISIYIHTYMYVCVYIMYTCSFIHSPTPLHPRKLQLHTYTYIHTHIHTYTHTYTHTCLPTYTHVRKHVCIHVCRHTYVSKLERVCVREPCTLVFVDYGFPSALETLRNLRADLERLLRDIASPLSTGLVCRVFGSLVISEQCRAQLRCSVPGLRCCPEG